MACNDICVCVMVSSIDRLMEEYIKVIHYYVSNIIRYGKPSSRKTAGSW